MGATDPRPWVEAALVHYPVTDKNGREIAAAMTPTDLHDLARSSRTYGLRRLWIVTPLRDQQKLAGRMLGFWQTGVGADYNPNRGQALDLIRVVDGLDDVLAAEDRPQGKQPQVWATSAREQSSNLAYPEARQFISRGEPVLILFGTAWGLTPPVLERCDDVLAPIGSASDAAEYNHLSVRSAAAVVLDRLLGR